MIPLTFLCTTTLLAETPSWGFFSGPPKVELLDDGRKLRLLEDFSYTDQSARTWTAPATSVVDGASIPRAFWPLIGGPLEGQYRNASIIHDVGCAQQVATWQEVHLTFYRAMRCGGVGELKAKIMYYAVYHFGPRWGFGHRVAKVFSNLGLGSENLRQLVDEPDAIAVAAWIEKTNPDLAELRATKPVSTKIRPAR